MIPKVFVSSTIKDLHYLRDAIRDAIFEVGYEPVMSEYGGVGYMRPEPAANACAVSIRDCHIAVFFLGLRYNAGADGLSVTHKEFRAAVQRNIPRITFVEPKLLHFAELYRVDAKASIWTKIHDLDDPAGIFTFLEEVGTSEQFNGIIPFTGIAEAKDNLKIQIAHMVGELLSGQVSPARAELQEVLAELKTLRESIKEDGAHNAKADEAKVFFNTARNLLKDRFKDYYGFLTAAHRGDSDMAIKFAARAKELNELAPVPGYKMIVGAVPSLGASPPGPWADDELGQGYSGHSSTQGSWMAYTKGCRLDQQSYYRFEKLQREIASENALVLGEVQEAEQQLAPREDPFFEQQFFAADEEMKPREAGQQLDKAENTRDPENDVGESSKV